MTTLPPELEPPIGSVLHATAIAVLDGIPRFNRDNLWGPGRATGNYAIWAVRETLPGSNGYKHGPWITFILSNGTACSTQPQEVPNTTLTWVRVASVEEALALGPDAYGPSR